MNKVKLKFFKNLLLLERINLYDHIEDNNQDLKNIDNERNYVNDEADNAHSFASYALLSTISKSNFDKVSLINAALKRIEDGVYGICMSCNKPIPESRLHSIPWATLCFNCKQLKVKRYSHGKK
jgi:DnaK suppressor protein